MTAAYRICQLLLATAFSLCCHAQGFELMDPEDTGVDFINRINERPGRSIGEYDYHYNGGGVAIGDLNNDGLPDLYFAGNDVADALYWNRGDFQFERAADTCGIDRTGWSTGVTLIDINEDGWLDVYVCQSGPDYARRSTLNKLYVNQQDGTFSEEATRWGLSDRGLSTHAAFFDWDLDGDMDLYVINHAVRNLANQPPDWLKTVQEEISFQLASRFVSRLYDYNTGQKKFSVEYDRRVNNLSFGLGLAVSDFRNVGMPDIYVANDYFLPDNYYVFGPRQAYEDRTSRSMGHTSFYSMGCDAADINNDGWIDLMTVDMTPSDRFRSKTMMSSMDPAEFYYLTRQLGFGRQYMFNSLQLNQGFGIFSEIALFAGVAKTDWSWAPLLVDFDNDGLKDLFVTNGIFRDVKNNDWRMELQKLRQNPEWSEEDHFNHLLKAPQNTVPNRMYRNLNGYQFEDVGDSWGFWTPTFSNGAAVGDLDLDGDLDLVINNLQQSAFLYRNHMQGNFIRFDLGTNRTNTRVTVYSGDLVQTFEAQFARGYQSYMEPIVHAGLGTNSTVDSVVFRWTSTRSSVIYNPETGVTHRIEPLQGRAFSHTPPEAAQLLEEVQDERIVPGFSHEENGFNDFESEILLPHRMSNHGPALAVADVDGDGDEDFFVGGAKGESSWLYRQENGTFRAEAIESERIDRLEIQGAVFLDYDADGDEDLYLATGGGGDVADTLALLQDLLLQNDGNGRFSNTDALPEIRSSTRAAVARDFDGDGDPDLFIGGRNTPGKYPEAPRSYLLRNDGRKFTDVTESWAPWLMRVGMVTDAAWTDWEGDGVADLVVVGEWMPILVGLNRDGRLEREEPFYLSRGWWQSVEVLDWEDDGDLDFIAGNIGMNNKFQPSLFEPLELYADDFDGSGSIDIVLAKSGSEGAYPIRGRECSSEQMPFILDSFPTYEAFAHADISQILSGAEGKSMKVFTFENKLAVNRGEGVYELQTLPGEMQLGPINSSARADFTGDGYPDIVTAGNLYGTEVETPSYDANYGILLQGREGGYDLLSKWIDSGVLLSGEVRVLEPIQIGDKTGLLVASNSGRLKLLIEREAGP